MRISYITLILGAILALSSCTREDTAHRSEPAAREAGREAYRATQDIKRGAKEAAEQVRNAGKELRQGWNEAKRSDASREKK